MAYGKIDSGAEADLISKDFIREYNIHYLLKSEPYLVLTINNKEREGIIIYKIEPIEVKVYGKTIIIVFNIILIEKDIILGSPWLKEYNPRIN